MYQLEVTEKWGSPWSRVHRLKLACLCSSSTHAGRVEGWKTFLCWCQGAWKCTVSLLSTSRLDTAVRERYGQGQQKLKNKESYSGGTQAWSSIFDHSI